MRLKTSLQLVFISLALAAPPASSASGDAAAANATPTAAENSELFVDPRGGKNTAPGTKRRPLRTISAALARLPEPLEGSVTIWLLPGEHETTGGVNMSERSLQLMHRMRPEVSVRFVGTDAEKASVLAWDGDRMVDVYEGTWHFERVQIG